MISKITKYLFSIKKQDSIIFFGSGRIAQPTLQLLSNHFNEISVITHQTHPNKKIKNQVQLFCEQKNISWSSPVTSKDNKELRKSQWTKFTQQFKGANFGIILSYGYMIPISLIDKFQKGLIIIHPSLLPKYRGGSPIFHAIANGEEKSGVSYIQISKGTFDKGNILHQIETPINRKDDYLRIQQQLAQLSADNLLHVLNNLDNLRPGKPQESFQKDIPSQLLKAPIVKDKKVNLGLPAQKVYNLIRAFMSPKFYFPAKQCEIIIKVTQEYLDQPGEIGRFKVVGKKLYVRCGDKYLRITGWYEPSRKQAHPGRFIAQFLKSGKYPQQKLKLQ